MIPGSIYGVAVHGEDRGDPPAIVDRMGEALWRSGDASGRTWSEADSAVAAGLMPSGSSDRLSGWSLDEDVLCLVEGEVVARSGLPARAPGARLGAEEVLQAYHDEGLSCLRGLEGSFNVLLWHRAEDRVQLLNDRLGYRHLYYRVDPGQLTFASRMAGLVSGLPENPRIDPDRLATWLRFTYLPGDSTLFEGVELLPPGSVLTFADGRVSSERYWRLDEIEPGGRYDRRRRARLEDVLRSAVRRAFPDAGRRMLGLTGGLDSRCLLAAATAEEVQCPAMTDGLPGSLDLELARRVAGRAEVPHSFFRTDPGELGGWLPLMVRLQGGTVPTVEAHPCRYLHDRLPFDGLVLGMVGEPARGGYTRPRDLAFDDRMEVVDELERRMLSPMGREGDFESLWRTEYRDVARSAPRAELEEALRPYRYSESPFEIAEHYYVESRGRRFLSKATLVVGSAMPVALPYLDSRWLREVFSLPLAVRAGGRVQLDMIRRLNPELLDLPFDTEISTTVLPGVAPRLRHRVGKSLGKLRRRIGLSGSGRDREPAFTYGRWSRSEMSEPLRELLYNPEAAYRDFLRGEAVSDCLDAHFSGREDHTHLVSALSVFELAHGMWVQRGRLPAPLEGGLGASGSRAPGAEASP